MNSYHMYKISLKFLPIAPYYSKNEHFREINKKYQQNEIFTYLFINHLFLFILYKIWTDSFRII